MFFLLTADVGTMMDTNTTTCPKEEETGMSVAEEEDEINVDNEGDEEIGVDQSRRTSDEPVS